MDLQKELEKYPSELNVETVEFRVTEEMVKEELNSAKITTKEEPSDRCVTVHVELKNGFILSETSCALSKENYSKEVGKEICLEKITSKLWFLLGFYMSQVKYELEKNNN